MRRYALGLYEKAMPDALSWREKLSFARSCGYDYVEISVDESDAKLSRLRWSGAERSALKSDMDAVGIPIGSMCLSAHRKYPLGSSDPSIRAESVEILRHAVDFSAELGLRVIQLAGYDVYYEPATADTVKRFEENLYACVEIASRAGVPLGFETMETPFMDTVSKSMAYVSRVNSPYLGVYPDIGNLTNAAAASGGNVIEDLRAGAGHLLAAHLKPTRPGQYRDLFFDDPTQHVDFPAAITACWELGVRRYVTELWCLGRPDWAQNIRIARRSMGELLDLKEAKA